MTPILLAIDPGRTTGFALFNGRTLILAGRTTVHDYDSDAVRALSSRGVNELVIELPQVYRVSMSKGDPNDLIKVAVEVGRWSERATLAGASVSVHLPNEWKGQIPKDVHHGRALRVLDADERAVLPSCRTSKDNPHGHDNNMLDAVSLGLWKLGRLPRYGQAPR